MAVTPKVSKSLLKLAYQMLGSKGGQARMKGLKKKDRTALAKKAAEARWGGRRKVASASTRNK